MQLVWSVFAITVAALTLVLAGRRLLNLGSQLVYSRLIAVGGMVAFSVERTDALDYRVRFEVGGPGVFQNVWVQLVGVAAGAVETPARRFLMSAGDDPVDWTFSLDSDADAWVLVTWVRPHAEGTDAEAVGQRLNSDQLYEWRWYLDTTRFVRTACRYVARRYPRRFPASLRDLPLYGRWRRTTSISRADMVGPADWPPPA